jgi:putative phosphoesterase
VRIGVLSDTHGFLDEAVFTWFADCDELWHAGDFGSLEVLERLRQFRPTRAVYGNVDGADLRAELPSDLHWSCESVPVYMTHIGGHPGRYDRKAKKELIARRPRLFICGHSHVLRVVRDPDLDLLYMNPGACGHQGWHLVRTLLRFTVASGQISAAEVIELGPRGRNVVRDRRGSGEPLHR